MKPASPIVQRSAPSAVSSSTAVAVDRSPPRITAPTEPVREQQLRIVGYSDICPNTIVVQSTVSHRGAVNVSAVYLMMIPFIIKSTRLRFVVSGV